MSALADKIRKEFGSSDKTRDAGLKTPDDVIRFDDLQYGENSKYQVLDVYRPKGVQGKLPVIVSVHGGGWVYGDKEVYQFYCMSLAQRGFAVINFTYRLAPEYKYPASVEDLNSVIDWVFENGSEYGLDTDNIFAVGDSAGGHILSIYTDILSNKEYAGKYDIKTREGFMFRAIALNCGHYKETASDIAQRKTGLLNELLPEGWNEDDLMLLNSSDYINGNYPPVFIMTCIDDFLKHQPQYVVEKLLQYNVPFVYRFYGDENNRLGHVFHCNMRLKDTRICNDEECEFFRRLVK